MQVKLLHNTPLWICSTAIRRCWASEDKSDTSIKAECSCCGYIYQQNEICTCSCPECECDEYRLVMVCGEKDKALIDRVGNQNRHSSTLEHLVYTFDITGISRACLQELARHRHQSLSVQSSRYVLKKILKDGVDDAYVKTNIAQLDEKIEDALLTMANTDGISNDKLKYMLPEALKTSLVSTWNARSLQNFLSLRTSKSALWEIRELAYAMYDALPEEHKYLFEESINND